MSLSLRKAGVAAGAAVLLSAAGASGAMAANTTVSLAGTVLNVQAGSSTTNAITVANDGPNTYRVKDIGSGVSLVAGSGISYSQIAPNEWSVTSLSGATITGIGVGAGDLNDFVSVSGTSLPSVLTGGDGIDHLTAGSGASTISGGNGDDVLTGGSAADKINGNAGNDDMWSLNGGIDTVDGGDGDTDYAHADNNDVVSNSEIISPW